MLRRTATRPSPSRTADDPLTTLLVAAAGALLTSVLVRAARRAGGGARARELRRHHRWHVPAALRARLERSLREAALDVEPEAAVEAAALGAVAAAVLTLAVAPALAPFVLVGALVAGPVGLRFARGRAERRFVAALPGGVEQVAAALRGGAGVHEALELLGTEPALSHDVSRVLSRADLGLSLAESLASWPLERPLPEVRAVAGALAVAVTLGGRAA